MNRLRLIAWLGLALWAGATVLLIPLAGRSADAPSADPTLNLPRGAEVTRELSRELAAFPGTQTPVAVVVYARAGGVTAQDRTAVDGDRAACASLSRDNAVATATASADGQALLLSFPIAGDETHAPAIVKQIKVRLAGGPAGLATAVTGSAGTAFGP